MLLAKLKISGHSMQPNLNSGDLILVSNLLYFFGRPKIGDVVAFKNKDEVFIKRIKLIKDNKFFLQGDNKKDSMDSRSFGFISKKQILGKVLFKI